MANSVIGENIRRDVSDQFKCVTENWMREIYFDRVKGGWPLKNGKLLVKLEYDSSFDDQDVAKLINQMPCHLGSYI